MTFIGAWRVTMTTPMGPQEMRLHLEETHGELTGRIDSALGRFDIAPKRVGDTLVWSMKATKPVPLTVTFEVTVSGDIMTGQAKLGMMGKSEIIGERLSEDAVALGDGVSDEDLDTVGPITGDSSDPRFAEPYIAVDEQRSEPAPHRYVQGGFQGTDAKFSFYFPPADVYQGRFFHNTYPLAMTSDVGPFPIQFEVAVGDLGFTFDSGAYYVQTNLGGADRAPPADPAIAAYRVNAAAARYSRTVAAEMYGEHRAYGYLFGGSGGAYQVMGSAENTDGVWDGFLPFVLATPNAIPSMFTIRMHALRILRQRDRFPAIMDAIEPGGSGDPYAELNEEESAALREAELLGFPMRGWWDHANLTSGYFANVAPQIPMLDPSYVEDFWSKPGYLGTDPASAIASERFTFDTAVTEVIDGFPRQFVLAETPARAFDDAHIVLLDGASSGKSIPVASIDGETIGFALGADQEAINGVSVGDRVRIDNSWALALQTYHRHQTPGVDQYAWDQFRDPQGEPAYPQRDILIGPIGAGHTAGRVPEGRITGKVLALECLMDIDALPWQADWYRSTVREALGAGFEDSFALWYIDNAQHENPLTTEANAHIVSFAGALQQGLRDLAAWLETGRRPADTVYQIVDTEVIVPADAAARGGVQPVIELTANGAQRAEVRAGEAVSFTATIETPPGAGKVVAAEWDFEGRGDYPSAAHIDRPEPRLTLTASHTYSEPGIYFAVLRTASHRDGDQATPYARVQNVARVRVVVS